MNRFVFFRWSVVALVTLISGCDRYFQQPSCHEHFQPGQTLPYVVDERGFALDPDTGLRWFRCQAGERLVGGQCIGQALELSQADALQYAKEFSAASGRVWRLPTVEEMGSLKQDKCLRPSVNTVVFPSVQISNYWTSSMGSGGDFFGCTVYTYQGNGFCREPVTNKRPFLLVLE